MYVASVLERLCGNVLRAKGGDRPGVGDERAVARPGERDRDAGVERGIGVDERRVDACRGKLADDHRPEMVGANLPHRPHRQSEPRGVRRQQRRRPTDGQAKVLDQDLLADRRLALGPHHYEVHVHVANHRQIPTRRHRALPPAASSGCDAFRPAVL